MSKIKIAKALTAATGNLEGSHACVQALEEDEREREIKYEKLITQMHRDNEKFIDSVQRELSFLRRAIYWATAFLGLAMVILSVTVAFFGDS